MRAAIAATTPWICSNAKFKSTGSKCIIKINLYQNSIANSFLILEDEATKAFCFIPICAEISAAYVGTALVLGFSRYGGLSVTLLLDDELQIELILSHFGKCSLLFNQIPDKFVKENTAFLKSVVDKRDSSVDNISNFKPITGENTILTPIVLSKTAKDIWAKWCLDNNGNFYTNIRSIKASFLTWNVAGKHPIDETKEEFCKVFRGPVSTSDLVVIAMEEIEMTVKSVVTGSSNYTAGWAELIKQSPSVFESNPDYVLATHDSVGTVFLAVLIKKSLLNFIQAGKPQQIKLGAGGFLANKAAILIPVKAGEAKILAIGCHLTAHEQNFEERNQQIHEILEHPYVSKCDYVFFVGDLNYRVALPYEETIELCKNNNVKKLLENDQLKNIQKKDKIIGSLMEPEIKFLPTYKFDKNSDVYDTSSKKRVPSYTDRILYRINGERPRYLTEDRDLTFESDACKHFLRDTVLFETDNNCPLKQRKPNYPTQPHCICYRTLKSKYSDHRPVHALYQLKVPVIDKEAMEEFKKIMEAKYEELNHLSKPVISVVPSVIVFKPPKVQIEIQNKSLVWAHWFIKKAEGKLSISPCAGMLSALESTKLTITFNKDFNVSKSFVVISIRDGEETKILFTEEEEAIPSKPIELSVHSASSTSLYNYESLPYTEDHFAALSNLSFSNVPPPEDIETPEPGMHPIPQQVFDSPIINPPQMYEDDDIEFGSTPLLVAATPDQEEEETSEEKSTDSDFFSNQEISLEDAKQDSN